MTPSPFFEVAGVPVHVGVLWSTAEGARACPRGSIRLVFDHDSGLIHNAAFDESLVDYSLRYDNALHFSPFFQAYEERLAKRLVDRYALQGKHVVEIGAGGGRFLGLLCELGDNRGTGYDPSHDPQAADARLGDRVEVVRDYYSERHADRPAALLCCRHVLEHIPEPAAFLRGLRNTLDRHPETVLYFEVPNSYLVLRELSIWDVIYEHCGYFVPESLGALFRSAGFEILDLHESYEGQFVGIEARPGRVDDSPCDTRELAPAVAAFSQRFRAKRDAWQRRLGELRRAGRRAVVWGGGAKAVSFLNLLELGDAIELVVDINPGKQGTHLAGAGQEIVAPEALREVRPDVVLVMNAVYRREIEAQLGGLGVSCTVLTA